MSGASGDTYLATTEDVRAACEEFEAYWDAWRSALPTRDAWSDQPLGAFLKVEGLVGSDVLRLHRRLPVEYRDLMRAVPLRWSRPLTEEGN